MMRGGLVLLSLFSVFAQAAQVNVGSKIFTESFLMGELLAQTLEQERDVTVIRHFGMGGTGLIYEALLNGKVDMYVEYTGTLTEAILKDKSLKTLEDMQGALDPLKLVVSKPIGFNNSYALAVRREFAEKYSLKNMSDLRKIAKEARFAFSYEFMSRSDGYEAMSKAYGIKIPSRHVQRMDHSLIYSALESGKVDVCEVYTTDAKVEKLDLVVLEDDRRFFPNYFAVILARQSFVNTQPQLWQTLTQKLEGTIDTAKMRQLNGEVDLQKKEFATVIAQYLNLNDPSASASLVRKVGQRTREHLYLVGISLGAAILIGLPLAILASGSPLLGQAILLLAGTVQTIPSLALLCFLIPVFGIGQLPALVALFLYGLLPIVMGVYTGLTHLDPSYRETAQALGLSRWQSMWRIQLPLVSPQILAGIKTSAIIGIGTATLAALIGAGGYGAPIVTGLAINDIPTILIGAIPAAVLALATHGAFEILRYVVIPKGLR
ncbi:MAG: glycine betaine ABC transporter substrate-binding protein [Bdellovibrionales bacterium]